MGFFFADQNLPFTVALGIVLALSFLEIFFLVVFGFALSKLVHIHPDLDLDLDLSDIHVDHVDTPHVEKDLGGLLSKLLGWLRLGGVPVIVSMILLLMFFGVSGYVLQLVSRGFLGNFTNVWIASGGSFVAGVVLLKLFGRAFYRFIPRDESEVVDRMSFLRETAVITLGTAKKGQPAEAKLKDVHGRTHYVYVEPSNDEIIPEGSTVLLKSMNGAVYECTHIPFP